MEPKINDRPLYNSRLIDTYIKLIKKRYSHINIGELLSYAGMKPYQVKDEGHWFTQEQINLFYEKLQELTGNKNIAREAGRYGASPETLGVIRKYILGLIGPTNTYELAGKITNKVVKSSSYESKRIGHNKVEITVTPNEGVREEPFQCENRMGYWEAVPIMFNYKLPEIEHTECMFKGGKVCRYIVSWQRSRSAFWKKIRNYTILSLSAACIGVSLLYPLSVLATILSASVFLVLLLGWYAEVVHVRELNAAIDNLRESSDKLVDQVNVNYEHALMINEIGQAISKEMKITDISSKVMQILEKRLDYDRGSILLANPDKTRLIFQAGFGYTDKQFNLLKNTSFHLDRPGSQGVFIVSFREKKPFLINDINELETALSHRSLEFVKRMKTRSFVCCPIIHEEDSLGILAVDNIKTKRPLLQSDVNLLMGIAPEIGISIHNGTLIESRERQFKSILQVLATSIDARDPLTAGHSEKVTEYAVGICRELGLPKDYCEMIRVASLLHDYGKIGVVDSVLKKATRLKLEEYEEIKTHVVKTREILEQINFGGIYLQVPEVAGSHHERIDGSGYPKGLKGDDIPLGARIIAVADFFEAITSKRHYRDPMPIDTAFELLREKIDIYFARDIVEALISYYNIRYHYGYSRRHKRHRKKRQLEVIL